MTPEEYVKDRIEDQIDWYDRKSAASKSRFIALQMSSLIAAASIPVFSLFSGDMWARLVVATLGSAAAATTGIVALCKFREHWIEYRTTAESLTHEKYMFLTGTGPYVGNDAFPVLVERVEALVSQEHTAWRQLVHDAKTGDSKPDNGEAPQQT